MLSKISFLGELVKLCVYKIIFIPNFQWSFREYQGT